MTSKFLFVVPGNPVPKGRPRFTRQGRTYTPAKTKNYESQIADLAKEAMKGAEPLETPVVVKIMAMFPVPSSYSQKRRKDCLDGLERHIKRPDLDNVVKAITDGMNGVVYKDDSQIVKLIARKNYGTEALVLVEIEELLN